MKYEKGNFITVPNKSELKKLDAQSQVLFMWLCSFTDEKGQCYPSVSRLAECCGLSKRTIIDRVKILIDKGLITKTERFIDDSQQTNLFQIHLIPSAPESSPSANKVKKGVTDLHPPHAPFADRTKSIELNPLEQKGNKENFKIFKETIRGMFKN